MIFILIGNSYNLSKTNTLYIQYFVIDRLSLQKVQIVEIRFTQNSALFTVRFRHISRMIDWFVLMPTLAIYQLHVYCGIHTSLNMKTIYTQSTPQKKI